MEIYFFLQILNILNKNSLELFDHVSDSINFKIIKEMLQNIFNINNFKNDENSQKITNDNNSKIPILIKKNNFDFNIDLFNEKLKIDKIPLKKIIGLNNLCVYIKYETLSDLIMHLFEKEIVFENKQIELNYNEFKKNKFLFENNEYKQIDYLILYLFYLSTQINQIIIIDSDLNMNKNQKEYKILFDLFNEIKLYNHLLFINSTIIDNINHNIINLEDEENL